jgi:hypothetical protein
MRSATLVFVAIVDAIIMVSTVADVTPRTTYMCYTCNSSVPSCAKNNFVALLTPTASNCNCCQKIIKNNDEVVRACGISLTPFDDVCYPKKDIFVCTDSNAPCNTSPSHCGPSIVVLIVCLSSMLLSRREYEQTLL